MKAKKRVLLLILACVFVLCTAFAFGCSQEKTYYTVIFMDGQTQVGEIQVEKGKKIENYPTAHREDENYVFETWCKDENCQTVWDRETERVTKDITLWAHFLYISAKPGNAAMTSDAFSNTVTWLQRSVNENTDFTVEILGAGITSGGKEEFSLESYKGLNDVYTVKWTPATKPQGGEYSVKISGNGEDYTAENLLFKGSGEQENPYLLTSQTDLDEINTKDAGEGLYYKVYSSFKANLSDKAISGKTFGGVLDGNGKTVTLESSDCGLFGILGEHAVVDDLTVAGAVANIQANCKGAIAAVNNGAVSYCTVTADITSTAGTVGELDGGKNGITGGAAGVAGINNGDIYCCNYSGQIRANVGGSGIAVINNGTISLCSMKGTIGAGNSVEEGSSLKAYSYVGGIAALNYGRIEKSNLSGSGKILAQRGEGSANDYIGGIAAVNQSGAIVTECYFDGIRVHGNKNVGGIAGANSGEISFSYAGGAYHGGNAKCHSYVGGFGEVGGIVGLSRSGGTVENCFVTSNVYAYSGNAYKVAQTSQNCFFIDGNLEDKSGAVSVKTDENNGNVKIEKGELSATSDYNLKLTDDQLAALNAGGSAFCDKDDVKLSCENENTDKEHIITVKIGGETFKLSSVEGNEISLKDYEPADVPEGKYFAGWAVEEDGEVAFEPSAEISYNALESYNAENITLYPIIIEGEKPQSKVVKVALWTRYVEEETAKTLFEAFENAYSSQEYTVDYTVLASGNNANYKTDYDAGDFNVTFAYKAAAVDGWQTARVEIYIYSVNDNGFANLKVGLNSSDDAVAAFGEFLATDTAKKIMNPAYISEDEAEKIEVTLISGGTQYGEKLTASNATDAVKITLPTLDAEEGFTFDGWALSETAAEGETLLKGAKGYDDLKDFATDNKLTLYARFTAISGGEQVVLKVGYWTYGGIVNSEVVENLKTEFAAYAAANALDFTIEFVEYDVADYAKVADLVGKINEDGDIDYVLGIGKSSGDLQFVAGTKVQVGGRYVAQLTDSENASNLHTYFTQSETLLATAAA